MSDKPKPRRFIVWAEVTYSEVTIEFDRDVSDEDCERECQDALDTLIGNGDTGWNEIHEDGTET